MCELAILGHVGRAELPAYLFSEASVEADGRQCETDGGQQAGLAQLIDSQPVQLIKHEPPAAAAAAATIEPHPFLFRIPFPHSSFSLVTSWRLTSRRASASMLGYFRPGHFSP